MAGELLHHVSNIVSTPLINFCFVLHWRKGTLLLNNLTGFAAISCLVFPRLAESHELLMVGRFLAGLNGGEYI